MGVTAENVFEALEAYSLGRRRMPWKQIEARMEAAYKDQTPSSGQRRKAGKGKSTEPLDEEYEDLLRDIRGIVDQKVWTEAMILRKRETS